VVVVSAGASVVAVVSAGASVVVVGGAGTPSVGNPRASRAARCAERVWLPYQPSATMPNTVWSDSAVELGPHP